MVCWHEARHGCGFHSACACGVVPLRGRHWEWRSMLGQAHVALLTLWLELFVLSIGLFFESWSTCQKLAVLPACRTTASHVCLWQHCAICPSAIVRTGLSVTCDPSLPWARSRVLILWPATALFCLLLGVSGYETAGLYVILTWEPQGCSPFFNIFLCIRIWRIVRIPECVYVF